MSAGIPSPDEVASFTTSDSKPYVRPITTNKNLGWASQHEPHHSCIFLIPPEVWHEIMRAQQRANFELRQLSRHERDLRNALYGLALDIDRMKVDPALSLQWNLTIDDLQRRYNEISSEITKVSRQIPVLRTYNAYSDILPGTVGYYWSEPDKAYLRGVVTRVEPRYIAIQLSIREIVHINRDFICTPEDYLQLESQARARNLRVQRSAGDRIPLTTIKL